MARKAKQDDVRVEGDKFEAFNERSGKFESVSKREAGAALQRTHRNRNRGNNTKASWSDADPARVVRAICAVTQHGCAVQFGYTRDMGAFVVRIVGDGEPQNDYIRPTEGINDYLDDLCADYTDI